MFNHPPVAGLRPVVVFKSVRAVSLFLFAAFALFSAQAQITEFPLDTSGYGEPYGITFAPDGAYWIAQFYYQSIGRVTTNGIATTPFILNSNVAPLSIVVGPDSNLWFTEAYEDKIGRISPGTNGAYTNGVLTEFPIHPGVNTNCEPAGLAVGSDGNLWFTEYNGNMIGKMSTNGVTLGEYGATNFQPQAQLYNIAAGPDGALWFTEYTYGRIGRITTAGVISEFIIPNNFSNCQPYDIIAGPDGAMWFTEFNSNRIGRLTLTSNYSDFTLPSSNQNSSVFYSQEPCYLTVGGDGNIWFTEFYGYNVARLVPSGTNMGSITEFPTPTAGSAPTGIASGPDKNIWFSESANNAVATFLMPRLTITLNSNSQFVLTWPVTATDYILQGNSNLITTNWINLTSPPPFATTNLFIYTNINTNLDFFRLFLNSVP